MSKPKLNRETLIIKVSRKLKENETTDAGLKDWAAGALLAITGIFSNVGDAMATPKDLSEFLEVKEKQLKSKPDIKKKIIFEKNNFKSLGGDNGSGNFSIKLGPMTLKGEYAGIGDSFNKFKTTLHADNDASDSEVAEWEEVALKLEGILKSQFEKENKNPSPSNSKPVKKDKEQELKEDQERSNKLDKIHKDYVLESAKKQQLKKFLDDMEGTNRLVKYQRYSLDQITDHYLKNPNEFAEDYPDAKIKYFNTK